MGRGRPRAHGPAVDLVAEVPGSPGWRCDVGGAGRLRAADRSGDVQLGSARHLQPSHGRWVATEVSWDCDDGFGNLYGTGYVDFAISRTSDPTGTWDRGFLFWADQLQLPGTRHLDRQDRHRQQPVRRDPAERHHRGRRLRQRAHAQRRRRRLHGLGRPHQRRAGSTPGRAPARSRHLHPARGRPGSGDHCGDAAGRRLRRRPRRARASSTSRSPETLRSSPAPATSARATT